MTGLKTEYDDFLINSPLRFTHQKTKLPSEEINRGSEIQERRDLILVNFVPVLLNLFGLNLKFLFSLNDFQTLYDFKCFSRF